jgi:hypothetical protein
MPAWPEFFLILFAVHREDGGLRELGAGIYARCPIQSPFSGDWVGNLEPE